MEKNAEKSSTAKAHDIKKKLFLFDVDGTIVPSGKSISNEMKDAINRIRKCGNHLGIVGGGSIDKIKLQMRDLMFHHYFTECGCVYHKNRYLQEFDSSDDREKVGFVLSNIYTHNIRDHEIYPQINILMKECMRYVSSLEYLISGNLMDLRNGLVYFSMVGMSATDKERADYIVDDKIHSHRRILIALLKARAAELGIDKRVCICEGGEVGLAIFPAEGDKIQVLEHLENTYDCIYYFGDRYEDNGNDQKIINDPRVLGLRVNSPSDTLGILKDMLEMYDAQQNEDRDK